MIARRRFKRLSIFYRASDSVTEDATIFLIKSVTICRYLSAKPAAKVTMLEGEYDRLLHQYHREI